MAKQNKDYDFSGIATAYDIECDDGRIIRQGAFDHQDGAVVPFVYRHGHDKMDNILGHATLKRSAKPPGIRAYVKINTSTPQGKLAHSLIVNGDLRHLSIWANKLTENVVGSLKHVSRGVIRELSVVIGGANRGAFIDEVVAHDIDGLSYVVQDEGIIGSGFEIELVHETDTDEEDEKPETKPESKDDGDETVKDVLVSFTDRERTLLAALMAHESGLKEEDLDEEDKKKGGEVKLDDLDKVWESMDDKKKNVLVYVLEEYKKEVKNVKHATEEEHIMTTSIFNSNNGDGVMSHAMDQLNGLLQDAISNKPESLREAIVSHGIEHIETLFPEAQFVGDGPEPSFLKEEDAWVEVVMGGIRKSPFSRTKTIYADLTDDLARARGYVKGNQKVEEIFPVYKRVTTPQTVYKKQGLDRDDMVDITDFDVVKWMKAEMRLMLREEIARAILVGDGRNIMSEEKINPDHIRPVYGDHELYSYSHPVPADATVSQIIDEVLRSQINYQGSGNLTMFVTPETYVEMMLVQDLNQRRIYVTEEILRVALGVNKIVKVPHMRGHSRTIEGEEYELLAVIFDLRDYNMGMDRQGKTTFFDDFDIDYNKYKYLYESRQSGALIRPKAAIILEQHVPSESGT